MRVVDMSKLPLEAAYGPSGSGVAQRSRYMTHWLGGSRSSASVYFEIDPGFSFGKHYHSAEETIIIIEGRVEVTVGDEIQELAPLMLAVAPALVPHDIRCIGESTAKCVGVWSSASVVSIWDHVLSPRGSRRAGTPIPEGI